MRTYSNDEIREKLAAAIEWKGAHKFAEKIGVSASYLSEVMNGKKGPNETILNSIGLQSAIIRLPRKSACNDKSVSA